MESSERSKRRHASLLQKQGESTHKLIMAGAIGARSEKRNDLARILKEALVSPSRPTKMRRVLFTPTEKVEKYSAEEALALLFDCGLSKYQYMQIRTGAKMKQADIYPPYNLV